MAPPCRFTFGVGCPKRLFWPTLLFATQLASLQAAPNHWVGPADGFWEVGSNWSDGVPTSDDDVSVDAPG